MFFKRSIQIVSLFGIIFATATLPPSQKIVKANLLGAYNPPHNSPKLAQKRTVTTGSRSNCHPSWGKKSLTLLVPESNRVHLTSRERPYFYFHANVDNPEISSALGFNLVNISDRNPRVLVEREIQVNRSGINKITLPDNISLENNKIYLWQLVIPCQNSGKTAQTIKAGVQKISLDPIIEKRINKTSSPLTKAQIMAENGFWYDAISLANQKEQISNIQYIEYLLKEQNIDFSPNKQ